MATPAPLPEQPAELRADTSANAVAKDEPLLPHLARAVAEPGLGAGFRYGRQAQAKCRAGRKADHSGNSTHHPIRPDEAGVRQKTPLARLLRVDQVEQADD